MGTFFWPSALSSAPHFTGALAHGLADSWLTKLWIGSGARGRRTETAQTTGVAESGTTTRKEDSLR